MSNTIPVARVNATGALIRLHEGNQSLVNRAGITATAATADPKSGRLIEVDGADYTGMVTASNDLVRIGQALLNNRDQRDQLLIAAMKIPNAAEYLSALRYDVPDIDQRVDTDTLQVSEPVEHSDATGTIEKADEPPAKSKAKSRKKKPTDAALADI